MTKINIILFPGICFLFMVCCQPTKPEAKKKQIQKENMAKLEGTWYLNEWDLYNRIYFQDSIHVALDSHIDTMYFYNYELKNDTLFLFDDHGRTITYSIILKLTEDSLVFAGLLDKPDIQRYSRIEIKQEK